jgi:ribonuclease Y
MEWIIAGLLGLAVGLVAAFGYFQIKKKSGAKALAGAAHEAKAIIEKAHQDSEHVVKDAQEKGRQKLAAVDAEFERMTQDRKRKLSEQERRLILKEETLDRKYRGVDQRERELSGKEKRLLGKEKELETKEAKSTAR